MHPAPELCIFSEANSKTQGDCMKKRLCSQETDSPFLRCSEIGQPSRVDSMNPVFTISLPLVFALTLGQSLALCIPVDYVIHVEKRECGYCLAINTTICEGFCMTWDRNVKKLLPRRPSALSQDVCTYKELVYRTVMIPGCQHHAVSYYSYPVAVSCKCGKCDTDYSDCVQEASGAGYCAMF